MEALAKLGIPVSDTLRSTLGKSEPLKINDPSDSDEYFLKHLVPIIMSTTTADYAQVLGNEGLLVKYFSVCQAYAKRSSDREAWQMESDFWKFVRSCLPALPKKTFVLRENDQRSKQTIIKEFVENDPMMVHLLRIKEWLEGSVEPFVPAEVRKASAPLTTFNTCHLDPDTASGYLDPLEQDYEDAQMMTIWSYLRRGKIEEAIAWCMQVDQPWRAAILSGGYLPYDPQRDGHLDGTLSGNPDRSIWRASVKRLVNSCSSVYEKAVYASLIGDFDNIVPVCQSWKDLLWAAIISITEEAIEEAFNGHLFSSERYNNLLSSFLERVFPPTDVFSSLYICIILRKDIGKTCFDSLSSPRSPIRMEAVLCMLFGCFSDIPSHPQYRDIVLHAYLTHLLSIGKRQYWMFVCSRLSLVEIKSDVLSEFFVSLQDSDTRSIYLKEAWFYQLPVDLALQKLLVTSPTLGNIDYILSDPARHRNLLVEYAAGLMRDALANNKVDQAERLLERLPFDIITVLVDEEKYGSFAKELLYYSRFISVFSLWKEWTQAYTECLASPSSANVYHEKSVEFVAEVIRLLQSDWLSDVERVNDCLFHFDDRERALLHIRSFFVTELIMLVVSVLTIHEPDAKLPSNMVSTFCDTLADEQLELWIDLRQQDKLDEIVSRLSSHLTPVQANKIKPFK